MKHSHVSFLCLVVAAGLIQPFTLSGQGEREEGEKRRYTCVDGKQMRTVTVEPTLTVNEKGRSSSRHRVR